MGFEDIERIYLIVVLAAAVAAVAAAAGLVQWLAERRASRRW